MPNTEGPFNPAYSTVKAIYLRSSYNNESVNIIRQNTECMFERLELVENVNDIFPSGVLIVKDMQDIVSRIKQFQIDTVNIEFFNGNVWPCTITSVSYLNNAASDTEENFIGIYISNPYYVKLQKTSLNSSLGIKKPTVSTIKEFVDDVRKKVFDNSGGFSDETSNYVLYKPLNTIDCRQEAISDNAAQYLNYLASGAVGKATPQTTPEPNFMFWTEFDGSVNFKYFYRNPLKDPISAEIDEPQNVRRIGIYNGDAVVQKMSDGNVYRKAYFLNSNPSYQYISKNYYYIRKTPKALDNFPPGLSADEFEKYETKALTYQFQDEGQKYNIELINSSGLSGAVPGAEQLFYDLHWGYYDGLDPINGASKHTLMGQNFGSQSSFSSLNIMGTSGYMPFVNDTEMWKNMFDMTEVHPNIPDNSGPLQVVPGADTNLQKVMDVRYNTFTITGSCADSRLEQFRKIELQNFIMYSLCCMGKREEECFFAALLRFEEENNCPEEFPIGRKYRYKWAKLSFEGVSGACGAAGACGGAGSCCGSNNFYKVENWKLDTLRSSEIQDNSWAINLNERGLTSGYLPPGWITSCLLEGFDFRPIGAREEDLTGVTGGDIFHIVKLCRYTENNNCFFYFTAENVVDGCCDSQTTQTGNGGNGSGEGSEG